MTIPERDVGSGIVAPEFPMLIRGAIFICGANQKAIAYLDERQADAGWPLDANLHAG